jgi:hypothetical protein
LAVTTDDDVRSVEATMLPYTEQPRVEGTFRIDDPDLLQEALALARVLTLSDAEALKFDVLYGAAIVVPKYALRFTSEDK